MKATMLGMLMAVLGGAGCAHGVINGGEGRDLRGAARLEQSARVLVVGPASSVHTSASGDPAVALYKKILKRYDPGGRVGGPAGAAPMFRHFVRARAPVGALAAFGAGRNARAPTGSEA